MAVEWSRKMETREAKNEKAKKATNSGLDELTFGIKWEIISDLKIYYVTQLLRFYCRITSRQHRYKRTSLG